MFTCAIVSKHRRRGSKQVRHICPPDVSRQARRSGGGSWRESHSSCQLSCLVQPGCVLHCLTHCQGGIASACSIVNHTAQDLYRNCHSKGPVLVVAYILFLFVGHCMQYVMPELLHAVFLYLVVPASSLEKLVLNLCVYNHKDSKTLRLWAVHMGGSNIHTYQQSPGANRHSPSAIPCQRWRGNEQAELTIPQPFHDALLPPSVPPSIRAETTPHSVLCNMKVHRVYDTTDQTLTASRQLWGGFTPRVLVGACLVVQGKLSQGQASKHKEMRQLQVLCSLLTSANPM